MANIYAMRIPDKTIEELIKANIRKISEQRMKKINAFRFEDDKKRSLCVEILLRHILIGRYNVVDKDLMFSYNKYGKPSLVGDGMPEFNLSHSGAWVVCATADKDIGVDIERVEDVKLSIAKSYFDRYEYEYIESGQDKNYRFFQIWTLKESLIKAVGKGLSLSLKSFRFDLSEEEIKVFSDSHDYSNYYFKQFDIGNDYLVSVSSKEEINDVIHVDYEDII